MMKPTLIVLAIIGAIGIAWILQPLPSWAYWPIVTALGLGLPYAFNKIWASDHDSPNILK